MQGLALFLVPFARLGRGILSYLAGMGAGVQLLRSALYWVFVGPFTGHLRIRRSVIPLMQQIGVRSLGIVAVMNTLIGAILVLQTTDVLASYGAKEKVAIMVCVATIRELGPLMTAILIAGRVGAAFTAGLGSMVINEEVLALKTMAIDPIGYLVAPRLLAICFMMPCLTAFSYVFGLGGGYVAGVFFFGIPSELYLSGTWDAIEVGGVLAGLVKSVIFGAIICIVSCRAALSVRGGPEGVGRNTMLSVVSCLLSIIVADAIVTIAATELLYKT